MGDSASYDLNAQCWCGKVRSTIMGGRVKTTNGDIEQVFRTLRAEQREAIILRGAALRAVDLQKRLLLARAKLQEFQDRYQTTLSRLEAEGLPDDASIEAHEDYILWQHWADVERTAAAELQNLQPLIEYGLPLDDHVGH